MSGDRDRIFGTLFSSICFRGTFNVGYALLALLGLFIRVNEQCTREGDFLGVNFHRHFLFLRRMGIATRRVYIDREDVRTGDFFRVSRYRIFVLRFPFRVNTNGMRHDILQDLCSRLVRSIRQLARFLLFLFRDDRSRTTTMALQIGFRRAIVVGPYDEVVSARSMSVNARRRDLFVLLIFVGRSTVINVDAIHPPHFRMSDNAIRRGQSYRQDRIRYGEVKFRYLIVLTRAALRRTRVKGRRHVFHVLQFRFRYLRRRFFHPIGAILLGALCHFLKRLLVNLHARHGQGTRRRHCGGSCRAIRIW